MFGSLLHRSGEKPLPGGLESSIYKYVNHASERHPINYWEIRLSQGEAQADLDGIAADVNAVIVDKAEDAGVMDYVRGGVIACLVNTDRLDRTELAEASHLKTSDLEMRRRFAETYGGLAIVGETSRGTRQEPVQHPQRRPAARHDEAPVAPGFRGPSLVLRCSFENGGPEGDDRPATRRLGGPHVPVGRRPGGAGGIPVPEAYLGVSRDQGSFDYQEGRGWTYTDHGSRNGTVLNGDPLPANFPVTMRDGDVLGIGGPSGGDGPSEEEAPRGCTITVVRCR